MSELFNLRYPGRTPADVLIEYIACHPGCTRGDIRRDLPSVSHESCLRGLVAKGRVRRIDGDRVRYEVIA